MKELPRAAVENVAAIFGQCSGAAKALREADAYEGPVQFYQHGSKILIKKLPVPPSVLLN
jgi:hypothetical protein